MHKLSIPVLAALLGAQLALAGCFGIPADEPVAATVNGAAILENEVTSYIEGFRTKNEAYGTDAGWAGYLASAGYTPETLREHVLDTVFVPNTVVAQECAKRNIKITDDQLQMVLDQEKDYYELRYGEDSWESVLASFGYDEQSWRVNEEQRLLEEQLTDAVVESKEPSKSEILKKAQETGRNYNGKHSYYVSFASQEQAEAALKEVVPNKAGKITKKRFAKAGTVHDAGWNSITAARDKLPNEYLNALNDLEEGQLGGPVEGSGSWYVIWCDATFSCPAEITYSRLAKFPEQIYAQLVADASAMHVDNRFSSWLDDVVSASEITVHPMPDGLPYDTDAPLKAEG